MTGATASAGGPLAGHVRLIRAAADLIEQAGVPGLTLFPWHDEIAIQVPEASGDEAARLRSVARIAALAGGRAAPGPGQGRVSARGSFAGHPVHVYTHVKEEGTS
jgi:hypothetical protein